MSDHTTTAAPPHSFVLDQPIMLSDVVAVPAGTRIIVRLHDSGALRGLALNNVLQGDVVSLETLAPRTTTPPVPKGARWATSDLLQYHGEVLDFLLPQAAKDAVSPQA